MPRENVFSIPNIPDAPPVTRARNMAAFDALHPRLRALVNYAPGPVSPVALLPGNRDLHGAEGTFWDAFPDWTPIERDPIRRPR